MKIPATPPDFRTRLNGLWRTAIEEASRGQYESMSIIQNTKAVDEKGRYLHWEELRFRPAPKGLDTETYWALTRNARRNEAKPTPFRDKDGKPFVFVLTDFIARNLHEIDSETRGGVQFAGSTPKDQEAERFLVKSLIEEPFNSSLLEGAATTRDQAIRLIRENKRPKTTGERMVINNYRAIEFIKRQKDELLTVEIIHELHRLLTEGTLEDERKAGAFRTETDDINVVDDTTGEILHAPPPAKDMAQRIQYICDFANNSVPTSVFIHPILRAIILHFMLAYEHPYVDGNGRTARALFYWAVVKSGYWLLEYVSISRIINTAPVKYGMAFLHTETDGNDLTYFFHHQLDVVQKAIDELSEFIARKQEEVQELNEALNSKKLKGHLNHRQLAILHDAIRSPQSIYNIKDHKNIHGISYLTARSDLEGLAELKFLAKHKRGNKSLYKPVTGISKKIGTAANNKP
jgi:Fic family protein